MFSESANQTQRAFPNLPDPRRNPDGDTDGDRDPPPSSRDRFDLFTEEEWDETVAPLVVFGPSMESLLRSLLDEAKVQTHFVGHRIKRRSSAIRKIENKSRSNYALGSLTDLLGLRIITYFDQEVDTVASIIEDEFSVDRVNSVDKRATLDPDRFGYISLHYVVRLNPGRRNLTEYRNFGDIRFEIQVRSVLQHAWAEIEHDLGYKSKVAMPFPVRRRFSRLAGLLELADIEFTNIRRDLLNYEQRVESAVRENRLDVAINRESVTAYIRESAVLGRLEQSLCDAVGRFRRPAKSESMYAAWRVNELSLLGFTQLDQLDSILEAQGEVLWRFARNLLTAPGSPTLTKDYVVAGVLLYYLAIAEMTRRAPKEAESLAREAGIGMWSLQEITAARTRAEEERDASHPGLR